MFLRKLSHFHQIEQQLSCVNYLPNGVSNIQSRCQTRRWQHPLIHRPHRDTFKKIWYNHCQSFKNQRYETSTELSKVIWKLKNDDTKHTITWRVLTKCQAYKPGSRSCNLCTTEKLLILQNPTSINSRSELVSKCRHARKFLIMNFWPRTLLLEMFKTWERGQCLSSGPVTHYLTIYTLLYIV